MFSQKWLWLQSGDFLGSRSHTRRDQSETGGGIAEETGGGGQLCENSRSIPVLFLYAVVTLRG